MYRNILVAVDDSEKSKLALNSAIHSAVVLYSVPSCSFIALISIIDVSPVYSII